MSLNLSFGGKLNKDKVLQQLEKDIKSLSKNLGVELEKVSLKDVDKATSQIQKQINQLSKNINLNINKISLGNNGALQDIQKQINSALKGERINLEVKSDLKSVSGDFEDILKKSKSLENEIQLLNGKMAKLSTVMDKKGNVKNTTLTYQYDEGRQAVEKYGWTVKEVEGELVRVFDLVDKKIVNNKSKLESANLSQEQFLTQLENRLNKIKTLSETQHLKNSNYNNTAHLESIQNVQNKINEAKAKSNRLTQEEKNLLSQELVKLDACIKKESSKSAEINRSVRFLTSQLRTLENLKVRVDNRGGKSSEQVRISNELEKQINLYKQLIAQNEILGSVERNRIQKNVNDLKVQSRELVTTSQFSNIFSRMKDYFIGTSIIGASIGVLKSSFDTIVEVDSSMRDLKKVTNESSQEYAAFENQANDMAKALGNQTKNVIEATAAFAQMSYSYQESKELAKNSIIFQNVGDIDSESANKGLIATLKAYNIQAKDSMDIIDKLNNVSNHYAVSVGGLNDAIMRGGSALSTANNDLSQSIALITTANSAIQDPAKVGNALKTISMNMRGMKQKGGETFPKLKKMLDETTHGSVKLTQVTKEGKEEFRSTYDVIKDLSMVWDDLNNMQKSMIAEKFAGKQNANVFFSLMLNAKKDLENIKKTADNSFGSAAQEQEAYMNSLSAKINSLKEDIKGLFLDLSDTDFLKGIISGIDTGISGLRFLVQHLGSLNTIVGTLTFSLTAMNSQFRKMAMEKNFAWINTIENKYSKINQKLKSLNQEARSRVEVLHNIKSGQTQVNMSLGEYSKKLTLANGKILATKSAMIALRGATLLLQSALSAGISMLVSFAIEKLVSFIDSLHTTREELNQLNSDFINNSDKTNETISSSEEKLKQIKDLQTQIANTNNEQERIKLQEKLNSLQKEMCQLLPDTKSGYNKEGEAIAGNNALIEEQIKLKKQQMLIDAQKVAKENSDKIEFDKYFEKQKEYNKIQSGEDVNKNYGQNMGIASRGATNNFRKSAEDSFKEMNEMMMQFTTLKSAIETFKANGMSNVEINAQFNGKDVVGMVEDFEKQLQSTQESADNAKPSIDSFGESLENTGYDAKEAEKDLTNLASAFSGLRGEVDVLDKAMDEFKKNGQLSADTIERIFATKDPRLISLLGDQNHFLENSIALEKQLKEERESAYTQEIAQAQYMVQSGMQAENDKTQVAANGSNDRINITNQETQAKMSNYSNDTNAHANSEGTKVANAESGANARTDATANETNQKANMYGQDAQNHGQLEGTKVDNTAKASDAMLNTNSQMFDQLGNNLYGQDANNYENLMNKKLEATKNFASESQKILVKILGSWEQYQYTMADAKVEVESGQFLDEDKLNADIAKLKAMDELKNKQVDFGYNPVKVDYSPKTSSGHSGHKGSGGKGKGSKNGEHVDIKDIEDKIDAYKSLTDVIDDVNNELEITKTLEENAQGVNKLQYMNKEINLYKQKKDAINNLIAAKQNEGRYLEGVLKNNGFNVSNGNISNYYDRLKQIEDEVNAMDNSNKAKEEAIKNFKDLKEKADKYFEITSKELPKLNNEWYQLNKTIKEVSERQVKLMGDTEREMTNVVKNQVEERKKALEDETSKVKEELKKQRDEYNKKYDDENFEKNLKEKQDKLNKLNAQIDSVRRDISSEGQSKLKDLLKQKDDLEKELNNFIRDRQKDQGNKAFDEQMDKIDKHKDEKIKEMEKTYTDEKIAELAKGMIQKGFVEIEGHVIKLRDALNDYYKKNGEVFADSSLKMQEYIDNLELTKKLYGELTSINNNLGVSSSNIRYNSGNNVVQAIPKVASFMAIPQGSKKANININTHLNVGSVNNGTTTEDIKSMLDERDRKIINEINEQLNSY